MMSAKDLNIFTPTTHQVLATARREAARLRSPHLSSEHILLGVLAFGQGIAATILVQAGLQDEALRKHLETVGWTHEPASVTGYGLSARIALASAERYTHELTHSYVGPEHIVLGLLDEPASGTVARAFAHFGIDVRATRQAIIDRISCGPGSRPPD